MDLTSALRLVRRRWLPLLLCVVAGIAGAGVLTVNATNKYEAEARLFVNIPAARGVQEALQGVQLSSQLIQSYSKVATSRSAAERVSKELKGQFTAKQVQDQVTAGPEAGTLLLDVTATDHNPQAARDLANATAKIVTQIVGELEAGRQDSVEARVIDPAITPTTRVSPRHVIDLIIGLLIGLAVGALVVVVLEALDRSIRTGRQAAEVFGVPLLASVPRHRKLDTEPLPAKEGMGSHAGEAYRSLRTALRFTDRDRPLRTILVTSPSEGEGKTTTAANLAVAFAQSGERVVVVDGDLRLPRLATLFKLSPKSDGGLTSVLSHSLDLEAVLLPALDRLEVLPPGPLPSNPSELLGSEAMVALLEALVSHADIVILDAPALLPVTDALVLAALVDAVVLVAKWSDTQLTAAEEARGMLEAVNANLVGVVLNGVRGGSSPSAYHRYGRAPGLVTGPAPRAT